MPNKIEQFLRVPLIAVSILAWGFVIVGGLVLAFQRMEYIGNKVTLGEVFTLASLIFALLLAGLGWLFILGREKAERKRTAEADAIILYRKFGRASTICLSFLLRISDPAGVNVFKAFPKIICKDRETLESFYSWLKVEIDFVLEYLPDAELYYDDLRPMYKFNTEFGDKFLGVIRAIWVLKGTIGVLTDYEAGEKAALFVREQSSQKSYFFILIQQMASVSLCLERCRIELGLEFTSDFKSSDLESLSERFFDALGMEKPFDDGAMNTDDYMNLLETIEMVYRLEFTKHRTGLHDT